MWCEWGKGRGRRGGEHGVMWCVVYTSVGQLTQLKRQDESGREDRQRVAKKTEQGGESRKEREPGEDSWEKRAGRREYADAT